MPRKPSTSVDLREVERPAGPVLHGQGADFSFALQALITAMNSTGLRESIMAQSEFPLPGDMPAFLILNQLIYRTTSRPSDLADAIGTGRSNISKTVRRLENAGLVGRMPDPEDGRHSVIGLTAEGHAVARRIVGVSSGGYELIFSDWTTEEFELLEKLVIRLVSNIDERLDHVIDRSAGVVIRESGDAGVFREPRTTASAEDQAPVPA